MKVTEGDIASAGGSPTARLALISCGCGDPIVVWWFFGEEGSGRMKGKNESTPFLLTITDFCAVFSGSKAQTVLFDHHLVGAKGRSHFAVLQTVPGHKYLLFGA